MKKLKICFFIAGFGQGGAQKQCIALLNELQKSAAVDLHLIYFYEEVNFPDLEQSNITLHKVTAGSFYDPRNILKVAKLLQSTKPDILFSWLQACDVYAYFARKFVPNCKWIMAERDSHYPVDPRFMLRRYLGSKADLIICNSKQGKAYWCTSKIAEHKVQVVQNILPAVKVSETNKFKHKPYALFAGRFEPQKNILHLTKVFCELASRHPQEMFYIIGNGTLEEEVNKLIVTANKENQVIVLAFQKNIQDYFQACTVFVNLSKHEGMPNTVIENIALKNNIVVSKIAEHIDLLGEDYPFYSDDLNSIEDAVQVIEKAAIDNGTHLTFGLDKLQAMTPKKVAAQYTELFNVVMHDS